MYQHDTLGCSTNRLGIAPLLVATTINQAMSLVGLNSSDPVKDQERITRIDQTFAGARAGNASDISCLRDMAQGVSSGPNDPRQCAVGSRVAAAYAKAKWLEFQGREAAGVVGGTLLQESNIPTTIVGQLTSNKALLLGGVVLAGFFLIRRK